MSTFKLHKVTAVPGLPADANAIYVVAPVAQPNYVEFYMTSSDGNSIKRIPTTSDIQTMINTAIAGSGGIEVVADITARNALSPTKNMTVLVLNATGDGTVASGAATYVYQLSNTTWYKIAEHESQDISLTWAAIQNKPTSLVADIDDAVTKRHAHTNKTQIDLIGQDGNGELTYNGNNVRPRIESTNW